jgi:hypothetical protein
VAWGAFAKTDDVPAQRLCRQHVVKAGYTVKLALGHEEIVFGCLHLPLDLGKGLLGDKTKGHIHLCQDRDQSITMSSVSIDGGFHHCAYVSVFY